MCLWRTKSGTQTNTTAKVRKPWSELIDICDSLLKEERIWGIETTYKGIPALYYIHILFCRLKENVITESVSLSINTVDCIHCNWYLRKSVQSNLYIFTSLGRPPGFIAMAFTNSGETQRTGERTETSGPSSELFWHWPSLVGVVWRGSVADSSKDAVRVCGAETTCTSC